MRTYDDQDKYRIKSTQDAFYYAAEIPSSHWGPPLTEAPKFKPVVLGDANVSIKVQEEWFNQIIGGDMFQLPYLVLIASDTSDTLALDYGYSLMKEALAKDLRINITDSSELSNRYRPSTEEPVVMLKNVYEVTTIERVQNVRDWCRRHEKCFRVICSAGNPSSILSQMMIDANAAFFIDSRNTSQERVFA